MKFQTYEQRPGQEPHGVGLIQIDETDPTDPSGREKRWGDFVYWHGSSRRMPSLLDDIAFWAARSTVNRRDPDWHPSRDSEMADIPLHFAARSIYMPDRPYEEPTRPQISWAKRHVESGGDRLLPVEPVVPGVDAGSFPVMEDGLRPQTWHRPDHETTMRLRDHGLIGYRHDLFPPQAATAQSPESA